MTTRAAQGQDLDRGPLLTVAQAGEYLGAGERFIRRLITERRIAYVPRSPRDPRPGGPAAARL
jgi:uroporphyrinogen-III decarboxylase